MNEIAARTIPEPLLTDLRKASNVVLLTHSHPDGDALGSLFACAAILEGIGKKVFCFLEEPVSHHYDFLPEKERASSNFEEYQQFVAEHAPDLVMVGLDCGDDDRLGHLKGACLQPLCRHLYRQRLLSL